MYICVYMYITWSWKTYAYYLEFKSDVEQTHGNKSNRLFKKKEYMI